jgi:hypothetical protein
MLGVDGRNVDGTIAMICSPWIVQCVWEMRVAIHSVAEHARGRGRAKITRRSTHFDTFQTFFAKSFFSELFKQMNVFNVHFIHLV